MNLRQFINSKFTSFFLAAVVLVCVWWIFSALINLNTANNRQQNYQEYEAKKEEITTPLLNNLPKKTAYWSISYNVDVASQKTNIKISTRSPHYRFEAYRYLVSLDPEVALKYQIEFVNHKNEVASS